MSDLEQLQERLQEDVRQMTKELKIAFKAIIKQDEAIKELLKDYKDSL